MSGQSDPPRQSGVTRSAGANKGEHVDDEAACHKPNGKRQEAGEQEGRDERYADADGHRTRARSWTTSMGERPTDKL